MFTGIIEAVGIIQEITPFAGSTNFLIQAPDNFGDLIPGASISVNGVCLTVTSSLKNSIAVTAVPETLRLTNLGLLTKGSLVNLERPLTLNAPLGGHYVQGHIDAVGEVLDIQSDGDHARLLKVSIPRPLARYIVKKGYITLDGMSLTVIDADDAWFTITLIPHTQKITIASQYQIKSQINIEVDILGKYIERFFQEVPANVVLH